MNVSDVMTTDVVSVHENTHYKDIAQLLAEHRISAVPVIDAEQRVVGVVSEADLLYKVEFTGEVAGIYLFRRERVGRHKAAATTAAELMSSPPVCVTPDTPVARAARVMDTKEVKRLPVVDSEERLVGIVSRRDLLRTYIRPDEVIHREIVDDVIRKALWIDPATVHIEVVDGVVTLSGELETKSLTGIVVRLTRAVDGVVEVADQLTYRFDDSEMLAQGRRAVGW